MGGFDSSHPLSERIKRYPVSVGLSDWVCEASCCVRGLKVAAHKYVESVSSS